jgi:NADPH:quinone reductase
MSETTVARELTNHSTSMRVVVFHAPGGPEVLSVIDVPVPEPAEGQVRVEVLAAPVFSADVAARSGAFGSMLPPRPYYTLGWDMAGTVEKLGSGVTDFAIGDSVIGMSSPMHSPAGTQAEYLVVNASELALSPAGLSLAAASTIPANGLTAVQALDALELRSGDTLAILGAAGAVGGYAAELAHQRDIRVIGVGSTDDARFITGVGAEFVPRSDDVVEAIRRLLPEGVDALLDAAGVGSAAMGAVRDGGVFAALLPPATPTPERNIRVVRVMLQSDGARLRELASLAERGHLTTRVARTYGFDEAAQAHAAFAMGGMRGRLILVP